MIGTHVVDGIGDATLTLIRYGVLMPSETDSVACPSAAAVTVNITGDGPEPGLTVAAFPCVIAALIVAPASVAVNEFFGPPRIRLIPD